jgi:hypothetical protein
MFDAEAIHAQIPSNIEPNYQYNAMSWFNTTVAGKNLEPLIK